MRQWCFRARIVEPLNLLDNYEINIFCSVDFGFGLFGLVSMFNRKRVGMVGTEFGFSTEQEGTESLLTQLKRHCLHFF